MIKKKLCMLIFKKELNNIYEKMNNNYKKELSRIKNVLYENERRYGLIEHIFNLFPNAEIVGISKNKDDKELISVINKSNTIYLFGERYQGIMRLPRINFEIRKRQEFNFEEKYIHIIDILMMDNEIGNGTVAMNTLLNYAKKIDAKFIDGTLSSVDDDHVDRRNHFYEKFGFTISDSSIKLEL